ncbi:GGDEF domain-containing protein [Mycobacterium sp. C31M]
MRLFSWIAGAGCFALAGLLVVFQFHPAGPGVVGARVLHVVIALIAVAVGVRWVHGRWPTHLQATAFAVWLDVAIAAAAVTMSTPIAALCVAAFLSVNGVYVAFLLGWRPLVAHLTFCSTVIVVIVGHGALTGRATLWDTIPVLLPTVTWVVIVSVCGGLLVENGRKALRKTARSAHHDPLTGLRNRRGMYASVHAALAGVDAHATVIAAVCDIDRFKQLNDSAGHAVGDIALAGMARMLKALASPDELTARIGGDELVLVAFTTAPRVAVDDLIDRLRPLTDTRVEGMALTASIGIATLDVADPHFSVDDVLRHADAAMYEAKRSGGATCVVYATKSTTVAAAGPGHRRDRPA